MSLPHRFQTGRIASAAGHIGFHATVEGRESLLYFPGEKEIEDADAGHRHGGQRVAVSERAVFRYINGSQGEFKAVYETRYRQGFELVEIGGLFDFEAAAEMIVKGVVGLVVIFE